MEADWTLGMSGAMLLVGAIAPCGPSRVDSRVFKHLQEPWGNHPRRLQPRIKKQTAMEGKKMTTRSTKSAAAPADCYVALGPRAAVTDDQKSSARRKATRPYRVELVEGETPAEEEEAGSSVSVLSLLSSRRR